MTGRGGPTAARKRRRSENERTRLVRSPDLRRIGWRSGGGRREEAREGVDDGVARGAEGQETNLVCGRLRAVGVGALLEAAEPLRGERRLGWGTVGRETRGGVVSGEALGSGVEGRWTIVASRIRTITKMEGRRTRCGSPPGRRDKLASALVAPLVMAPVGSGMGVEEKIALSGRPGFRRRARTRRASGRAKRGITRAPREKESAPLVSIGSRTSGTVRTRHADYVSRGVCFSRGRLSADRDKNLPSLETDARGAGCASSEPGARTRAQWIDRRSKNETESNALPPKGRAAWSRALAGWSLLVLSPGAFSHSRPRTKTRARASCPTDRRCGKISADDGRRRRPSLTPTRADLDPIVEFHPNARVAF